MHRKNIKLIVRKQLKKTEVVGFWWTLVTEMCIQLFFLACVFGKIDNRSI